MWRSVSSNRCFASAERACAWSSVLRCARARGGVARAGSLCSCAPDPRLLGAALDVAPAPRDAAAQILGARLRLDELRIGRQRQVAHEQAQRIGFGPPTHNRTSPPPRTSSSSAEATANGARGTPAACARDCAAAGSGSARIRTNVGCGAGGATSGASNVAARDLRLVARRRDPRRASARAGAEAQC
jgi:hypothetical protein